MIITPADSLKNATATLWLTTIDAGASASSIGFFSGSKPASPSVAPNGTTQILLGTCTCAATAAVVTGATMTFNTITGDTSADNTGTATWARVFNGDGVGVIDVDVSDTTGSAFLKMNSTAVVATGPLSITTFVINF